MSDDSHILHMVIQSGDHILICRGKHEWLVQVAKGKEFHTHFGVLPHDEIIGKEFGDVYIAPQSRVKFVLLRPLSHELSTKFARKTQIIYPKDVGYILLNTGIAPSSTILEAGTGSGALIIMLANFVKKECGGRIITYEISKKHYDVARENIRRAGHDDVVDARLGDITSVETQEQLRAEGKFDACILDLSQPWELIDLIYDILKPSGILCSFSPVIEQVKKTVAALRKGNWYKITVNDIQLRSWQVKENASRPVNASRHTGFMVFARKINESPPMEWNRKSRRELARQLKRDGVFEKELEDGCLDFLNG
ncbi:MAG: tRNA (adenine-N1)-methyltransferase [Promethearchaeota archaeon]